MRVLTFLLNIGANLAGRFNATFLSLSPVLVQPSSLCYSYIMIDFLDKQLERLHKHKILFDIFLFLFVVIVIILFIPLAIIFVIGSAIHNSFYTGVIYRRVGDQPKKTWL